MEYTEFRRHLGKAGISVNEFASLIDINPQAVYNYTQKAVPRHYAVIAVVLGDAVDQGADFRALLRKFGITWLTDTKVAQLDEFRKRRLKKKK